MNIAKPQSEVDFVAQIPGFVCVKNPQSYVIALSQDFATAIGWKMVEHAIGAIDHDMPCKAAELADEFINLDQTCMRQQKKLHAIQIVSYQSGWQILFSQRVPVLDGTGNVIKMWITALDFSHNQFSTGLLLLNKHNNKMVDALNKQVNYIIGADHQPLPLSEKQEQCLFLLVRGKTMKNIAHILGISLKTVETHIDAIKIKLKCFSKPQLIEKALESGFFYYIPQTFLSQIQKIILN